MSLQRLRSLALSETNGNLTLDSLFNNLFRPTHTHKSKLCCITGPLWGWGGGGGWGSAGGFPSQTASTNGGSSPQKASNAESVSMSWHHHAKHYVWDFVVVEAWAYFYLGSSFIAERLIWLAGTMTALLIHQSTRVPVDMAAGGRQHFKTKEIHLDRRSLFLHLKGQQSGEGTWVCFVLYRSIHSTSKIILYNYDMHWVVFVTTVLNCVNYVAKSLWFIVSFHHLIKLCFV